MANNLALNQIADGGAQMRVETACPSVAWTRRRYGSGSERAAQGREAGHA